VKEKALQNDHRPLVADCDDLAVGKLVALLERRRMGCELKVLLEIEGEITKLFLDVCDNFTLGGGAEGITSLLQDLIQVLGKIATGEVKTEGIVREGYAFVDGDSVSDAVARLQHDTGSTTRGKERQDGLMSDVEGGNLECLKHDLGHLFTVDLGVEGSLSEQHGVFFGNDVEFIIEQVMPDLLHIIPVCDDTTFDGVLEVQKPMLGLSLVAESQ
jgi:hypothetical protein